MAPPVYADMGKNARDLFSKGYHFGSVKLDCKTKSSSGLDFNSVVGHNLDTNKVNGHVEVKMKVPECGLNFTEKWTTDNVINTELALEDKLAKGLKVTGVSSFSPFTGKWSLIGKSQFKHEMAVVNLDCDFFTGPKINGALTLGYKGALAGYQCSYDTCSGKLLKSNVAFGYVTRDVYVHGNMDDGTDFGGSIYHKITPALEAGVQMGFTVGPNTTRLGIGCKYAVDPNSVFRAKLNNANQLGLSFAHKLKDSRCSPGTITATVSSLMELKCLNQGGHKLGLCLEMES